ncbi:MAG: DnaD domain protein [Clostridia bacterium]|nr:DnaD domain protein [Clostridia bacterium]
MKITGETSQKFGSVPVSNLFISDFMPGLGGDAVKVYLTLSYYSGQNIKYDEAALANVLGVNISVVDAALIELESRGLILREGKDIVLPDIIEKHVRDNYNPRTAPRSDAGANDRTHLLRAISDRFFGGQMSQSWYNDIILWADTYGFCDEVVFMIFQQNTNHPMSRPYMKKVMDAYGERGIRTVEQMNSWLQKRDTYVKIRTKVASNLKLNPLTVYQEKFIEKWFYEYGYGFDVIDLALKEGAGMKNPSFNLYDRILSDWHDAGLADVEAVRAHIAARRKAAQERTDKAGRSAGTNNNSRGRNYDQRQYGEDFYDSVYGDESADGNKNGDGK